MLTVSEPLVAPPERSVRVPRSNACARLMPLWTSLALLLSLLLWGNVLRHADMSRVGDLGLISALGPSYILAIVVCAIAMACAASYELRYIRPVALTSLLFELHGTSVLVEPLPRFATGYLHVGITADILRTGVANGYIDARLDWPGGFGLFALLVRAAGVNSALAFLAWAPVAFEAINLLMIYALTGVVSRDPRVRWLTLAFFCCGVWIGQDYLSPQAVAFVLSCGLMLVVLTRFSTRRRSGWLAERGPDLVDFGEPDRRMRVAAIAAIVAIVTAIVATHQLTPLVLIVATGSLVLTRRITLTRLPVIISVIFVTWISIAAEPFWRGHLAFLFGGVGNVGGNLGSTTAARSDGGSEHHLVLTMRFGLTLLLVCLAIVGVVARWREGDRQLRWPLLAFSPFAILATQSYGGEALLRATLFALPWLAALAGMAFFPSQLRTTSARACVLSAVALCAVTVIFPIARYGNELFEMVPPQEWAGIQWMYSHVPRGSLVLAPSGNLPWRDISMTDYDYANPEGTIITSSSQVLDLLRSTTAGGYFVTSQSQAQWGRLLEGEPADWLDTLDSAVMADRHVEVIFSNPEISIYHYVPGGAP
jgi:hypothetical protein